MRSPIRSSLVVATSALALLAAPVWAKGDAKAPPPPGQIAAQANLQTRDLPGIEEFHVKPGVELANYARIHIATPEIAIHRSSHELMLDDRTVKHAREEFTERLTKELGAGRLAAAPGPGVAVIQITVTDYTPNKPFNPRGSRGGYIHESIGVGDAAFQAVIRDGTTNEVVAVLADADRGLPLDINLRIDREFGDADHFVRGWARQIAELFLGKQVG